MRIIKEAGLSRTLSHMEKHDTGLISASRNMFSSKDNRKRTKNLKAKFLMLGYSVTDMIGSYIENYETPQAVEVKENSLFVVDIKDFGRLEKDLKNLGEEFDQDSILFIPKNSDKSFLCGTNKTGYPGYGVVKKFNTRGLGKSGEFMTKVRGRPFIFESMSTETNPPYSFFSGIGVRACANENWKDVEL